MDEFEVRSCEEIKNISENKHYKKLEFTSSQKLHLGGLAQSLPAFVEDGMLGNAYMIKFPEGVDGHLMNYINGGVGNPIIGENGLIVGHASLHKLTNSVAVMSSFNVISLACGQIHLHEINKKLTTLNQSIDKILEFLYSDKKAELIAEVEFARYAYENYSSIMSHDEQRVATIVNLQGATKVAMKDIEFYLSDLNDTINSKDNDVSSISDKSFQIKSCLELSLQLYFMSNILEMYFSRNLDETYIAWIEKSVTEYLSKCEKRILSNFSKLSIYVENFKNTPLKKIDKPILLEQINTTVNSLGSGTESEMCIQFRKAVQSMNSEKEFYVDGSSDVYLKIA